MKLSLNTILFILIFGSSLNAQTLGDIFGEAAQEFFGGEEDTQMNYEPNTEAQLKFKMLYSTYMAEAVEKATEKADQYSAEMRCLYLMGKYIEKYEELKSETTAEADCTRKYDLYGMQLMAIISTTSFMYCTEGLYNMYDENSEEFDPETLTSLGQELTDMVSSEIRDDFETTIAVLFGGFGDITIDILRIKIYIEQYFHPGSLFKQALAISPKMDALKECAGH